MKTFKMYISGRSIPIEVEAKSSTDAIKMIMHMFPAQSVLRCEPVNELIPKGTFNLKGGVQ